MLGGELTVKQAAMFDGFSLDGLAALDDGGSPAEVGVCRGHVAQALVVAACTVIRPDWRNNLRSVAGLTLPLRGPRFRSR